MDSIDRKEFVHVFTWFDFGDDGVDGKPETEKEDEEGDLVDNGGERNYIIYDESAENESDKRGETGESGKFRFGDFGKA